MHAPTAMENLGPAANANGTDPDSDAPQPGESKAPQERTPPAFVRLSKAQHQKLKLDAERSGMSIPTLLKTAYFKRQIVRQLLDQQGTLTVLAALHKISDLLNQATQKLNAGFREGFHQPLTRGLEDLAALRSFVGGIYGHR